ncbi:MAG: hypothetical protein V4584_04315 [Verrucomicrobiota bacterium]
MKSLLLIPLALGAFLFSSCATGSMVSCDKCGKAGCMCTKGDGCEKCGKMGCTTCKRHG